MDSQHPLATPDYQKYEGLEVHQSQGLLLQLLRQLSLFRGRELAIVVIAAFGLAVLYKSGLTETVQILLVSVLFLLGISDELKRDSNAASGSKASKSPSESRHAGRNKGAA